MAAGSARAELEKLDLSNDEAKRLCEAFKNEDFRKMFIEYAEELQDPENKKRYEEELRQLEAERGMDVKFIHPEPGYVVKTSVNGETKAFINICKNQHVGKPEMKKAVHPLTGKMAPSWSLPHSTSPARDDMDNKKEKCKVYDVVFHPDAYRMGETNVNFRKMLTDSALDTIERQFGDKLDRKNLKFPKMKFKGTPTATVMRSRKDGTDPEKKPDELFEKMPYPYENKTSEEKSKENEEKVKKENAKKKTEKETDSEYEVPKYSIVHRQNIDFQDFRFAPDSKPSTRPKELVIHIDLPLLKSATSANLDIFEKRVLLESTTPAKYKLDLSLPYPVDEDGGSAKFDKSKKRLTVTLPVLPGEDQEPSSGANGDVGVNGTSNDADHTQGNKDDNNIPNLGDDVPELEDDVPELEDDVPELEDDIPELEDDIPELEDDVPELEGYVPKLENDAPSEKLEPTMPATKPLIEVLSSTTSSEQAPASDAKPLVNGTSEDSVVAHMTNGHASTSKDIWDDNDFDPSLLKPKISYKLPAYTANQDAETATFILSVKNVQRDSISKSFDGENSVQVKFMSMGSGGFPMHYSYMVKFGADYKFDVSACDISMSSENVVMILGKSSEAAGIWDKFLVGTHADNLGEALFVTDKTLTSALDQLDANSVPLNNNDKMPDLEVTDMNDDHLTIQLSNVGAPAPERCNIAARSKKYSESSDDIEVVHTTGSQPNLHGILKDRNRTTSESSSAGGRNRTISESSDEVFNTARGAGYRREDSVSSILSTGGSASEGHDVSESEDPAHRKKSVSFSEYVDSTTYKSNASVTMLHAALKKKSKRHRKKEVKLEARRRRRSSGSEHEHSSEHDETSEGVDGDEDVGKDHQGASAELPKDTTTRPSTSTSQEEEDDESINTVKQQPPSKKNKKNKKKNKKGQNKGAANPGVSEAHAASHTPPETKAAVDSVTSEEGESTVESVNTDHKAEDGERTIKPSGVKGEENGVSENGSNKKQKGLSERNEDCDSDDTEEPAIKARTRVKDKDAPETVLSWDSRKGPVDPEDRTTCAFSFSNTMMYDLDDD